MKWMPKKKWQSPFWKAPAMIPSMSYPLWWHCRRLPGTRAFRGRSRRLMTNRNRFLFQCNPLNKLNDRAEGERQF